jgi:hypothetical protein
MVVVIEQQQAMGPVGLAFTVVARFKILEVRFAVVVKVQ